MTKPSGRPGEDELIARYFAPIAGEGALGLKDDAALLRPPSGHDLVVTADAIVAGVHFFPDDPPGSIAMKALGVNVSDLAAKGAAPTGFVMTLMLPQDWTEAWLAAFCEGLGEAARAFGCPLLGGDTVRGPALALSVTAFGEVAAGRIVRRTTARPRLALTPALLEHASAAMDVSDGLAGDLAKMMRASGTAAIIEGDGVPLSPAARAALAADASLLDRLVTGGDDYEILATVPPGRLAAFLERSRVAGVATTAIGTVTEGKELPVFRFGGAERRYQHGSYSH